MWPSITRRGLRLVVIGVGRWRAVKVAASAVAAPTSSGSMASVNMPRSWWFLVLAVLLLVSLWRSASWRRRWWAVAVCCHRGG